MMRTVKLFETHNLWYKKAMPKGKAPKESRVTMTQIVLPGHANALGTVFGGTVMSWIDIAAAISAQRHARDTVVTASIDALHFIAPIKVGQVVEISAIVNFVARSSMEVGVRVESEDPRTGKRLHNVSAYTTFVCIGQNGKPSPVPPLEPQTEDEKRRFAEAQTRKQSRLNLAKELKEHRH